PEKDLDWSDAGVEGSARFLNRVWRLFAELAPFYQKREAKGPAPKPSDKELRDVHLKLHQTIRKVTEDIGTDFHFNTAISAIMELVNKVSEVPHSQWETGEGKELLGQVLEAVVLLLSPFVPHFCEESWRQLGYPTSLLEFPWPGYDEEATRAETVTVVVQVNGKLRGKIELPPGVGEAEVKEIVAKDERIQGHLEGKAVVKTIFVTG